MPHFVIATDFSPVAQNAMRYACCMAEAVEATVTLVHTYIVPVAFGMDTPLPVMPVDEARDIARQRIEETLSHLRAAHPALSITCDLVYGEAIDALADYLEQHKADLLFLGNSGTDDADLWMGSTVLDALRQLPVAVVAVPQEAAYAPVRSVGFACDYEHLNGALSTETLTRLLLLTGARLHVVSVFKTVADAAGKVDPAAFKGLPATAQPTFHTLISDRVDEGIQRFVAENQVDWLAVIPQKHSFIEGIFRHSHTKAMVRMSHIPLVALHEQKKNQEKEEGN